jgi:hypothetical protein
MKLSTLLVGFCAALSSARILPNFGDTPSGNPDITCMQSPQCHRLTETQRIETIKKYFAHHIAADGELLVTGYTSLVEPPVTVIYECADNKYPVSRRAMDIGQA